MDVVEHLRALVSFDTQNPPRSFGAEILEYIKAGLAGFEFEEWDHGEGRRTLLATRGAPEILINFHLDTVPAAAGYTRDPHVLHVEGGRAYGLGACDIKGASAAAIAAAQASTGPIALLFTTDEEAGSSECVRRFCDLGRPFKVVLVAEPTSCKAVLEHRGILTYRAEFEGVSGHASSGRAESDSALHHAVRWANQILDASASRHDTYKNLSGLAFNLGRLEGGVKPNMIASSTELSFGFRPLPGMDGEKIVAEWAFEPRPASLTRGFYGPPLPSPCRAPAAEIAQELGLEIADPVNFWTEASLFSQGGYDALVFGPGDIAQAHTADEWVSVDDLHAAFTHYRRIMSL